MEKKWWQQAVVYQIYPRSFQDSNHDGIGDLKGIISRLDYLKQLGIDAIWLSPVYKSPNEDNGYDISDYQQIMDEFGTMEDMEELIQAAHKRSIRIVMDLVVNHTSDQHPWFVEARKSKDNPYRDYYIWADAKEGQAPNALKSAFSGSAWTFDEATKQYYLHLFSQGQPDLNWENERMRQEIYDMMNFWIAKGVGGFRLDVIDLIGKIPEKEITSNGPQLHAYLKEMHQQTFGKTDLMTVGETWGATPDIAKLYSNPQRKELSMVFQFEHMQLDQQNGKEKWDLKPLEVTRLKEVLSKWQTELGEDGWNSLFWNNHDLPRVISRFGEDQHYRVESGKMLAILLHGMKGTPYIYQGEEIGMINFPIKEIEEADDVETINVYHERLRLGYSKEDILESINQKGRDNARRPMQWDDSLHAGFTTGTPWLALHPSYATINVQQSLADPDSLFYTYQTLIRLRKQHDMLAFGAYELLEETASHIFAYKRMLHQEEWLVVANMTAQATSFTMPSAAKEVLIANYPQEQLPAGTVSLRPYEAFIVQLEE